MKKTIKMTAILLVIITMLLVFYVSGHAVATELEAGSSKAAAANIPEFGVEYVSEISVSTESDWFKFTTHSEEAFYDVSFKLYSLESGTSMNFAPCFYLYDEYLQEIDSNYNSRIFNHRLEKNTTYYIKIQNGKYHNATGTYEVKVTYRIDEIGSSKEQAKLIEVNKSVISSLDGQFDVDYFIFTAPVAGKYDFFMDNYSITGNGTSENFAINLYLYNEFDKCLGKDYCAGNFGTAEFSADLDAGETYYLKVAQGKDYYMHLGEYEVKVSCDTVSIKELTSISVSSMPSKIIYTVGENFAAEGMVVNANYSDGTSAIVTTYNISGFDSSTAGTGFVTISYTENGITKTCQINVTIEPVKTEDDYNDDTDNSDAENEDSFSFFDIFTMIISFFMEMVKVIADLVTLL